VDRPTWDNYYLGIAEAVSARGDCTRRKVGAVIVKDHKIVSTGYNGTPPGDERSCGATGQCPRALAGGEGHSTGEYDQCWATHAEANALLRATWGEMNGATLYTTAPVCPGCAKLARSAGIACIVSADLL
jgi:dCMP deaminase